MTVPGHIRRRYPRRLDVERVLILIGAIGIVLAVAVALWGKA